MTYKDRYFSYELWLYIKTFHVFEQWNRNVHNNFKTLNYKKLSGNTLGKVRKT